MPDIPHLNQLNTKIKHLKPRKNGRYQQGYINPLSCKKLFPGLKRDIIIYRSSYEKKFIHWLESNPNVKYWGSECINIQYQSLIDNKIHTYFPDYLLEMTTGEKILVEIKPHNQTVPPVNENGWAYNEYMKNKCKWKAAKEYCDSRGLKFRILTERSIDKM